MTLAIEELLRGERPPSPEAIDRFLAELVAKEEQGTAVGEGAQARARTDPRSIAPDSGPS